MFYDWAYDPCHVAASVSGVCQLRLNCVSNFIHKHTAIKQKNSDSTPQCVRLRQFLPHCDTKSNPILNCLHIFKLLLHTKQVYLMLQSLNPSSSTQSDTFHSNTPQSPGLGGGGLERWSNYVAIILLLRMSHLCPGKWIYLKHFSQFLPHCNTKSNPTPQVCHLRPVALPCAGC
jgi:hypothetical protein